MKYHLPLTKYTRRKGTTEIVVHAALTLPDATVTMADVRGWHTKENGWIDTGYHFFIRRDGTLELGRPLWAAGAHVEGHNGHSVGICLAGGGVMKGGKIAWAEDTPNNYTPEQLRTLRSVIATLQAVYPTAAVMGHREFPGVLASGKRCPAFNVGRWLDQNPSV